MKHRILIIGLPHTELTDSFSSCAFTQKVRNLCRMMKAQGNEVIVFSGGEQCDAPCDEFVSCMSRSEQAELLEADHYVKVSFDKSAPIWSVFNLRLVREILKRRRPGDILCFCMGVVFSEVASKVGQDALVVESGVGYSGVFAPYQVFESHAQRHAVYAQRRDASEVDGRFFDEVIPNAYDPERFPVGTGDGNYLYVGRMIARKGLRVIEDMAKRRPDLKFVLAGPGGKQDDDTITGQDITITGSNLTYLGEVGPELRASLMGNAKAVLCPTLYVEPFCGVNVEAQLCGAPVITTDWGAFTETVEHGLTGFRCKMLHEFVEALDAISLLDRDAISARARSRYSLDMVGLMYQRYFDRLAMLCGGRGGWYAEPQNVLGQS